jgi:hypothetical protein
MLLLLLLLLLAGLPVLAAGGANLLADRSFANGAAGPGGARGWSARSGSPAAFGDVFRRVQLADGPAMSWTNDNASFYSELQQRVAPALLVPSGYSYTLSALVKTEGVQGVGLGASVCAGWATQTTVGGRAVFGAPRGGLHPAGVQGTQDWTLVRAQLQLPGISGIGGASTSLTVSVYAGRGNTGRAWFRNVSLVRGPTCCCTCACDQPTCEPPLTSAMLSPSYRGAVTSSAPVALRVVAALRPLHSRAIARSGVSFAAALVPACNLANPAAPPLCCPDRCQPLETVEAAAHANMTDPVAMVFKNDPRTELRAGEHYTIVVSLLSRLAPPTSSCRAVLEGCWPVQTSPTKCAICEGTQPRKLRAAGCTELDISHYCGGITQRVLGRTTHGLYRVPDSTPPPAVYVDEQTRLIVHNGSGSGGRAFFPVGLFAGALNETDFQLFGDSAFNTVMPYTQLNRTQLDWAHAHGVRVAFTLKDAFCGMPAKYGHEAMVCNITHAPPGGSPGDCPPPNSSSCCCPCPCLPGPCSPCPHERAQFRASVLAFRSHPAILLWYLNDELPLVPFGRQLTAHQQWAEEFDSTHPTWTLTSTPSAVTDFLPTADLIGTDPYPYPGRTNISVVRAWTEETRRLTFGARPLIQVIQAHNLHYYDKSCTACHAPSARQQRSMAWQAIAAGANGIVFFSYMDLQRNPELSFELGWRRLDLVAAEIQALAPMLLSDGGRAPPPASVVAASTNQTAPWVLTRAQWVGNASSTTYMLFVVGDGSGPQGGSALAFTLDHATFGGRRITAIVTCVTPLAPAPRTLLPTGPRSWVDAAWESVDGPYDVVAYRVQLG